MMIKNQKKILNIFLVLFLGVGIFFLVPTAHATVGDWAGEILGGLIGWIIGALGIILSLVIQALVSVAQYSNFIGSEAVKNGWVIVRDVCNMFFVLILLIIAFATILKLEGYDYKKWLPKLILMAILINFSKTICGLLIDVAQIVMMTFVNAFKDIAAGNLVTNLGLKEVITLANNNADIGFWAIVGAYVLGLVYVLISLVVVVTMLAMLVMRIVMIWIYIVLSPAAYLMSAFPGGQKYASQWWSEFIKNLIVGPVLAFFIWLSFVSLQTSDIGSDFKINKTDTKKTAQEVGLDTTKEDGEGLGATQASTPDVFIRFIIAIGMLIGGLKISQEIGGAAGGIAGKGMAAVQKGQAFAGTMAVGAALLPWKGARMAASYGTDKLHQKTGTDLNLQRAWGVMQAKRKEHKAKRYGEGVIAAREAQERGGRMHGILAMTGNPADSWEQMTSWKGFTKRLKGGERMKELRDRGATQLDTAKQDKTKYEFEEKWANSNKFERKTMMDDNETGISLAKADIKTYETRNSAIDKELKMENKKAPSFRDTKKIKDLELEKSGNEAHLSDLKTQAEEFRAQKEVIDGAKAGNRINKVYTDEEKAKISKAKEDATARVIKSQQKIDRNVPEYAFEARATEQKLVSQEASKLKDITDSAELFRILQDAIRSHDTTMVKAITLKMTKDGNDNEFTTPLMGDSGYIGLQGLMRQFSTKGSENYAGFSEQEAFSLGSQIAELNKATKHWAATAAYKMDNGEWKEMGDREHNETMMFESGKRQQEACIREDNRLAYGTHDKDGKFHINAGGIMKLQSMNNKDGHGRMSTMNESAARYCYEAIMENPKLKAYFETKTEGADKTLIAVLQQRLGALAQKETGDFHPRYDFVIKELGIH